MAEETKCNMPSGCDPKQAKIQTQFTDISRVCDLPDLPKVSTPRITASADFPSSGELKIGADGSLWVVFS